MSKTSDPEPVAKVQNRRTRTVVELYDNRERAYSKECGYAYVTLCVDHNIYAPHDTKDEAKTWMSHPDGWCDGCKAMMAGQADA